MKVEFKVSDSDVNAWKYYLEQRYGKGNLNTLAKKAFMEIVSLQANKEAAEVEKAIDGLANELAWKDR